MFSNIGQIAEKFIEIENKKNLLRWSIKGIKVYQLLRYKIYFQALDSHINTKKQTPKSSKNIFQKLVSRSPQLKNFLFSSPLGDKNKSDYLLFESSRKQLINGKFADPFTKFVKDELTQEKKNFTIYQSSYFYDKLAEKEKNTKHLDRIYLLTEFKAKKHKIDFIDSELKEIQEAGDFINKELGLNIDFLSMVRNEIVSFQILSGYFSEILDNKNPKRIYIVNFCDKAALISECKKRKIEVIDIQHGLMSDKDVIYHYPNVEEGTLDYFPDKFYAWSDSWLGKCKLPIRNENIEFVENRTLLDSVKGYERIEKEDNKVLLISQDTITHQILSSVKDIVLNNPSLDFYFKPHPNEYSYIENLEEFQKLSSQKNFHLVPQTSNLYKLFAESKNVIGVYSAALIEAMYFGCNVFILDLPGAEMMDYLIESGKMKKAKDFNNA